METIIEKIKKIKKLADSTPYSGEKEVALSMLDGLLKKYNISIDEIFDEKTEKYLIKYYDVMERQIIVQIVKMINPNTQLFAARKSGKLIVELTQSEFKIFEDRWKFHSKLFRDEKKKQLNALMHAYINKHNLFPEKTNDEKKPEDKQDEMTLDEIERILKTIETLQNKSYHKSIES